MKVGIDARLIDRGGIGRYIRESTRHLLQLEGENQYVVYGPSPGRWLESLQGVVGSGNVQIETLKGLGFGLKEQLHLVHLLRRDKVDLFHVTYDFGAPLVQVCPMVLTLHDAWFRHRSFFKFFTRYLFYQVMTRYGVRSSAKVIAVSQFVKSELVRCLPSVEEKIEVIYHGVDPRFRPLKDAEEAADLRRGYGIKEPYILSIGTFEPKKNLLRLLKAFSRLLAKMDQVKLVMVGRYSFAFKEVTDLVRRLRLESSVRFIEHVPEEALPLLYGGAEVFVLPSLHEGFGLSVLEAMACGVPVIASKAGALPEITGDASLLVDPYDEKGLMEAIRTVLLDESLKARLITKGLARARLFSWKDTSDRLLTVYQSISG